MLTLFCARVTPAEIVLPVVFLPNNVNESVADPVASVLNPCIFKFVEEEADTPVVSNLLLIFPSISFAVSFASTFIVVCPRCPCIVKSSSAIVLVVPLKAAVARFV